MRCPNCQTQVPEGATACPSCNALLDPNVINGDPPPPPQTYEETGRGGEADYQWGDDSTDPRLAFNETENGKWGQSQPPEDDHWGQPQPSNEPTAHLAQPDPKNATRVLSSDPERDKHTRVVQAPPPPRVPPRKKKEAEEVEDPILSKEFEAAIEGLKNVYKRLKKPEKAALWTTVAAFVACFSPWYYIKGEGLVSGIESQGWIPAILTGATLILLYVRFSLKWGILPSLLQLLLIAGAAFGAVYFTLLPAHESIRFGLPATALTTSLATVFTILGMLSRT